MSGAAQTRLGRLVDRVDIDAVVANSFRDLHVKGLDYLCLRRSADLTVKLYFFSGDARALPEVVSPHDHRYDFATTVMAGASENVRYGEGVGGQPYEQFEWRTPLNGGDGFTWTGTAELIERKRRHYAAGAGYFLAADWLHTIRIVENETVLMIEQFESVLPRAAPTRTFMRDREPPSLDGLYRRFTPDEVVALLRRFEDRTGIALTSERAA